MPISQSDQIFNLIKSLTKAEKRNFKLYVGRMSGTEDAMFVQLFEVLDKSKEFNEQNVRKSLNNITSSQLSNLKRHLYTQILTSLRLLHTTKDVVLQIREQLDYAKILYSKGLYMQSLKILNRVRSIASHAEQYVLLYEVIDMEKMIEEKHITRSRQVEDKVETLIETSTKLCNSINKACHLANLKLNIHGLYIQIGHVKNASQAEEVTNYFYSQCPEVDYDNLEFFEKIYLHQSYVWYYYILLDFTQCLSHALRWTAIHRESEDMILHNPDIYLRGLHYCAASQYQLRDTKGYAQTLEHFSQFSDKYKDSLSHTSKIILFLYRYYDTLDYYMLTGEYEAGIALIPRIKRRINRYESQLDTHRILTFYYRFAWLFFATKNYDTSIEYLNKIIDLKAQHLREDIQCYAWLLLVLCHWEKGHYRLLSHFVDSAARFFNKMKSKTKLQSTLMAFIRTQLKPGNTAHRESLYQLRSELLLVKQDKYERKSFAYLDALKWVDAKLQKTSISEICKQDLAEY